REEERGHGLRQEAHERLRRQDEGARGPDLARRERGQGRRAAPDEGAQEQARRDGQAPRRNGPRVGAVVGQHEAHLRQLVSGSAAVVRQGRRQLEEVEAAKEGGETTSRYARSIGRPCRAMNSGKAASALAPRTTFVV